MAGDRATVGWVGPIEWRTENGGPQMEDCERLAGVRDPNECRTSGQSCCRDDLVSAFGDNHNLVTVGPAIHAVPDVHTQPACYLLSSILWRLYRLLLLSLLDWILYLIMDSGTYRFAVLFMTIFMFGAAFASFQLASDVGRNGDMHSCFMYISCGFTCIYFFVGLLSIHVQLEMDPSAMDHLDRNGPNGPPGPGPSPGGRAQPPNGHSSQPPRRGPGRGGSWTSSRSSESTPLSSSGRYSRSLLLMIVLIAIMYFQFVSSRGNEYFCEIDEDYLTDRFNLTGLNTEVSYYQYALDLVTDVFDLDADDDLREQIEKSARHLYGLVHARYIVTTRGLAKMVC